MTLALARDGRRRRPCSIGVARWASGSTPWGAVAVVLATLAWAAENVVSRPLAERNPFVVVFAKSRLVAP